MFDVENNCSSTIWSFFVHTLPNTHYLKLFYELRLWQRKEMGENRGKWKIMKEMSLPVYCLTATNCNAAGRTNWQNFTEDDTDVREYEVISTWRVHSHMYITSTWFQPPASTAYVLSFPLAFLCHLSGKIPCYLAFKNILNLLLISISSTAYFLTLFLMAF